MYLALILFAIVAAVVAIVAIKAVRAALRMVRSSGSGQGNSDDSKKPEGKESKTQSKEKEQEESTAKKSQEQKEESPAFTEGHLNRYAAARDEGISESFWEKDTEFNISTEALSKQCIRDSRLSTLEMADRNIAGSEFYGFNLLIEENRNITLTYQGQAVATLTRLEKTVSSEKGGETVSQTKVTFRTNTFPPHLKPGMVPDDLEKMLGAVDRIVACNGNPELVAGVMTSEFCESTNIIRLRQSIDPKIQEMQIQGKDMKKGPSEKPRDLSQRKGRSL